MNDNNMFINFFYYKINLIYRMKKKEEIDAKRSISLYSILKLGSIKVSK